MQSPSAEFDFDSDSPNARILVSKADLLGLSQKFAGLRATRDDFAQYHAVLGIACDFALFAWAQSRGEEGPLPGDMPCA
jgi:hypothetical protein